MIEDLSIIKSPLWAGIGGSTTDENLSGPFASYYEDRGEYASSSLPTQQQNSPKTVNSYPGCEASQFRR